MGLIKDFFKGRGKEVLEEVNNLTEGKGTTRLKIDDDSDSGFTKSIRPLITVWVLSLSTYVMLYDTGNSELDALVYSLLSDIVVFYFAARTTEKVVGHILTTIKSIKMK